MNLTGLFVRITIQEGTGDGSPDIGIGVSSIDSSSRTALDEAIERAVRACYEDIAVRLLREYEAERRTMLEQSDA